VILIGAAGAGYYFWSLSHATPPDTSHVSTGSAPVHTAAKTDTPNPPLASEVPSMSAKSKQKSGWHMTFADEKPSRVEAVAQPSKTKHIQIKVASKKNVQTTAEDIEQRFRSDPDKDDALFLARYYYEKKQYKQSLKWSLETNKIDSNTEESWLLFAKAKAKLGERMEAIRILQTYYDRTGSPKARKLLGSIRRGQAF